VGAGAPEGRPRKKILIAAHVAIDPEWTNCKHCTCKGGVSSYPRWSLAGLLDNTNQCPRYHTPEDVWPWIELYGHYQSGNLYRAGGVREQPALYMRVMRLIDGVVKESRNGEANGKVQN
jgi:hypothetical protein